MSATMMPNQKLGLLAQRIADTLGEEVIALCAVRDGLAEMLEALRLGKPDELVVAAENLQDLVYIAGERRTSHKRQMELFFRVSGEPGDSIADVLLQLHPIPDTAATCASLADARSQIREVVQASGRLVASSQYALGVAGQINHELIVLLHGLMQPDGGRVYTSQGSTTAPRNRRSMIDRVG